MSYKAALKTTGFIAISLASIIAVYFIVEPITDYLSESGLVWLSIVSNASLAIIVYLFVRWFNKTVNNLSPDEYGFGSKGIVKNFFIGGSVAAFLVFATLFFAFIYSGSEIRLTALKQGSYISLVEFIMANLVVAAWEEIYFRGLVVNTLLRQNLSFKWVVMLSSGIFTVVHVTSYDLATITPFWMIGVFFISTILLLLYVLTKSIWTSIGCHFCWDSLFMSLDERENDFGILQMENYINDAVLIDNISIFVTGAFLFLFLLFRRSCVASMNLNNWDEIKIY